MMNSISLKKKMLVILMIFFCISVNAQKFIITDVICSDCTGKSYQEVKKELLGTKVTMNFYDNSVRLTLLKVDGTSRDKILDVSSYSNIYTLKEDYQTTTLTLNKVVNYISSAKLQIKKARNNSVLDLVLKRE